MGVLDKIKDALTTDDAGPVTVRALQMLVGAHVDGDWAPRRPVSCRSS